jgi:hypothetical protein
LKKLIPRNQQGGALDHCLTVSLAIGRSLPAKSLVRCHPKAKRQRQNRALKNWLVTPDEMLSLPTKSAKL